MRVAKTIDVDSVVSRDPDIDAADLNGEIVMMNIDKGKYFALNEVGSRIWNMIVKPQKVGNIIDSLLTEYEIDRLTCENEVLNFLGRMYEAGLINIA